jgi:hypothetical protein
MTAANVGSLPRWPNKRVIRENREDSAPVIP